jgi:hypothetical protein
MTDLHQLFELAGADPSVDGDALPGDLRRGRLALSWARRRRAASGILGVVLAGAAGFGLTQVGHGDRARPEQSNNRPSESEPPARVVLLSQPLVAGPYEFAATPEGWKVQGENAFGVVIAPTDGSVSSNPDDFAGKLVILFDQNPPSGAERTVQGREFWLRGDSGYTTIATRTLPGEPEGVVSVQFPADAGWSEDTMLRFLSSVSVGPAARPGVG